MFIWKILLFGSRPAGAGNRDFLLSPYLKNNTFELPAGWGRKSWSFIKSSFKEYNFWAPGGLKHWTTTAHWAQRPHTCPLLATRQWPLPRFRLSLSELPLCDGPKRRRRISSFLADRQDAWHPASRLSSQHEKSKPKKLSWAEYVNAARLSNDTYPNVNFHECFFERLKKSVNAKCVQKRCL